MKRRSINTPPAGNEQRGRAGDLHSRRRSRLRHNVSSKRLLRRHVPLSLVLLQSILVIYIAANRNSNFSSTMVAATSYNIQRTSPAFCSHNIRQMTPSLRSGKFGNNMRSHSFVPSELGMGSRTYCNSSNRGSHPPLIFPLSSTSALGVTENKRDIEEIDAGKDTTAANESKPLEAHEINIPFQVSAPSADSGLPQISTNNVEPKSEMLDEALAESQKQEKAFFARVTVLFSLVVLSVLKMSPSGCWRYYLAGGICASTSHAVTTPIDVVKTRQQVDPMLQGKSMRKAALSIVQEGGTFALLAGLGPTALGYLLEGGIKFGIYEVSKPVTQRSLASIAAFLSLPGLNSKLISLLLCGTIAGTAASLMLSPMEALRIRMVSDSEYAGKSSFDAMSLMIRREGVSSISKGLPAILLKQVPYTITKNCSFDMFTMSAYRLLRDMGYALTANVKIAVPLFSAAAAAVLSCISSHPGDMLLSLVNAHEGPKRTREFAKEISQGKDGLRGFFVGIKPRFVHVIFIVTVQLMIYDFVKQLVGIAATGL